MKIDPRLADAMALLRAGKPQAATRLIQSMVGLRPQQPPEAPAPAGDVIDLVPERVTVAPAPPAPMALGRFKSRHGTIRYRLHRPDHLPDGAPLLMMLHGCTQDSADFATGTAMNPLAESAGYAVLWPEQSPRANPRRCWRWFEAAHQGASDGEPAMLLALARHVASAHRLDPGPFAVAGLSAGGAMAAVLADCAPDRIAAIAVHSGLAAGVAGSMAQGLAAMQRPPAPRAGSGAFVPTLVLHGEADGVVAPANADALFEGARLRAGLTPEDSPWPHGRRTVARDAAGHIRVERLMIAGAGHAWSGGDPAGSHASASGPSASAEILRFLAVQRAHPPG